MLRGTKYEIVSSKNRYYSAEHLSGTFDTIVYADLFAVVGMYCVKYIIGRIGKNVIHASSRP